MLKILIETYYMNSHETKEEHAWVKDEDATKTKFNCTNLKG